VIHISKSEWTPPKPNGCEHKNTEGGYGLAGGGMGSYTYCNDCHQVIEKWPDADEDDGSATEDAP